MLDGVGVKVEEIGPEGERVVRLGREIDPCRGGKMPFAASHRAGGGRGRRDALPRRFSPVRPGQWQHRPPDCISRLKS